MGRVARAEFQLHPEGIGFTSTSPAPPGPLRSNGARRSATTSRANELRMRLEMGLSPELQMMVVCRTLMDKLEAAVSRPTPTRCRPGSTPRRLRKCAGW